MQEAQREITEAEDGRSSRGQTATATTFLLLRRPLVWPLPNQRKKKQSKTLWSHLRVWSLEACI